MQVLGVAGSLREASHNRRLLRAAADELPPGVELIPFDGLKAIEPFDETDEHEAGGGMPGADGFIAALRDADAVLFVTPEYNGSIPGVLKNAVDWASRPTPATSALANKPVAVIGASTGMFGAVWAQAELRKALGLAGARVLDQELAVPTAHEAFRDDGRLTRGATRRRLRGLLADLIAEVAPAAVSTSG
ncbi:MAG: NAD(P)H-dependent oxidoreductase [Actinomycetota bacterium]|nr:NAD(P)H-dependent oxidoreductase [Actinomycetota bacterium]